MLLKTPVVLFAEGVCDSAYEEWGLDKVDESLLDWDNPSEVQCQIMDI